ncbi:hypothetical protein K488DRAFT_50580 [Vararia minispora EC-137]|uniref:Uncharacterized protein n=1 Tax=Vararia minispora EC-137 TaxID=1314806 RepID=A0ACB8QJX8_9AGAM|nr:hypothetical protein K488DRAFT_50580 [Vararia minispora EC-137]
MASNTVTPSDEELRATAISLKGDNPSFGVARLRALLLQENSSWTVSEGRLKKILQSEGLINNQQQQSSIQSAEIYPSSRLVEDLDIERWSSLVEVKYFDKRKGKGLVAKEKIASGETIWKEDPFILAPEWELYDMQQLSRVCAHCTTPLGESALIVRCPASTSTAYCPVRFCTRLCLSRAQRTHPLNCIAQNPASAPLLAFARKNNWLGLHALAQCTARLLLDAQSDDQRLLEDDWKIVSSLAVLGMEERAKGIWFGGSEPDRPTWKKAHKLYLHAFDVPMTPAEQKKLARFVKKQLPPHIHQALFPYEEFLRGLGRMSLNLEGHGGLYTLHSHLNHDCDPNVSVRHFDQRTALSRITLVARRDIEPGEELMVTYVDPNMNVRGRRNKLGAWNFGTCKCKRCLEEEKTEKAGGQGSMKDKDMEDLEKELKAGLGVS